MRAAWMLLMLLGLLAPRPPTAQAQILFLDLEWRADTLALVRREQVPGRMRAPVAAVGPLVYEVVLADGRTRTGALPAAAWRPVEAPSPDGGLTPVPAARPVRFTLRLPVEPGMVRVDFYRNVSGGAGKAGAPQRVRIGRVPLGR